MAANMRIAAALCLGFLGLALQGCDQSYEVNMTYKCDTEANGACTQWSQVGSVKEKNDGSCFPGSAQVLTSGGAKPMSEVRVGEEIMGYDHSSKTAVYTVVRAWLHRDEDAVTTMTVLQTEDAGDIEVSGLHAMAVDGGERYDFSANMKDSILFGRNHSIKVVDQGVCEAVGLYAPLTMTSNYFVSGKSGQGFVLAHSFAHMEAPQRFELPVHAAFSVYEYFTASNKDSAVDSGAFVHPVARTLMDLGGRFLMVQ